MAAQDETDGALFVAYLRDKLPAVEEALGLAGAGALDAQGPVSDLNTYLYQPLCAFTARGGKRIRPVLALLGTEAVGGRAEDALAAGIAIELFQSAALIHDDIADKSELRRGEPCLHKLMGTGPALNVGDLALTEVFEIVLNDAQMPDARKLTVLRELVVMERHTLEGQALDLGWAGAGRWDFSSEDCRYMIDGKTAWYSVAMPLSIGAICGGADAAEAEGLVELGRHAGLAFQLQDDLLNLVGDAAEQGKDFRSDITEGKRTFCVMWALEHLEEEDRLRLMALLEAGTSDPAELDEAVLLIERGGGVERARELARSEVRAAKARARELSARGTIGSDACALLCSMASFFVERSS